MNQTIQPQLLKCVSSSDEIGNDEIYVLVTTVDLTPPSNLIPGLPPVPNFEVFRYGIFEDLDDPDVRPIGGPPCWGPSSTPMSITAPDHVAIVVSVLENDNGTPEQYQSLLRAVVPLSLASSLGEPDQGHRAARLTTAIRDALNGVDLPIPFALDDDHVGTQQLLLDGSDVLESGHRDKVLDFDGGSEGHYELTFRITAFQPSWRFCGKCRAMFFDDSVAGDGVCPAGGAHEAIGLEFALAHDSPAEPDEQADWRFCGRCSALFFAGDPVQQGTCPAGGPHQATGFNFVLLHDVAVPANHQGSWRFCAKCNVLHFAGEPNKGVCAAPAPSVHEAIGLEFFLPFDSPGDHRQGQWRYCGKCRSVFYDSDPATKGVCSGGGGHEAIGVEFFLPFDSPGDHRQGGWRFCGACMRLFFAADPANQGFCAVGGAGHAAVGLEFFLPFDSPGDHMQGSWRFCGKDGALFWDGEPSKGLCARPAPSSHEALGFELVVPNV